MSVSESGARLQLPGHLTETRSAAARAQLAAPDDVPA